MASKSPLRYPGGKSVLSFFLSQVLYKNEIKDGVYVEAFAGGAGAALNLLLSEKVSTIILNDLDPNVYKFWHSILTKTTRFIDLIRESPIRISEWRKQKDILNSNSSIHSDLRMGFAFFYLNRCNRSGIMSSGPIGGYSQNSEWKINARFRKRGLIERIKAIAERKEQIKLFNEDANDFILKIKKDNRIKTNKTLMYFDPPYYQNGRDLYKLYFNDEDHKKLSKSLKNLNRYYWVMSYDKVPFISNMYDNFSQKIWAKNYFANKASIGKELIIHSERCIVPRSLK